jgi:hypothetical protein
MQPQSPRFSGRTRYFWLCDRPSAVVFEALCTGMIGQFAQNRRIAVLEMQAAGLHLRYADQMGSPDLGVRGSLFDQRLWVRLAVVLLEHPRALMQRNVAFWLFGGDRPVSRAGQIVVREPRQHLTVLAVVHDDLVFERFVFHCRIAWRSWARPKWDAVGYATARRPGREPEYPIYGSD